MMNMRSGFKIKPSFEFISKFYKFELLIQSLLTWPTPNYFNISTF